MRPFTVDEITGTIRNSRVYRSLIRQPWPETSRTKALTVANNFFLHLHPTRIPAHALKVTYTFCLGGLSFFLFLMLTLTGILLMFYYIPSVERAYTDIQALESAVSFGMLLRNVHRWAAHGMVITVFLHMCRVFYTGSYKPPREFNWVIGVALLFVTFMMSFTGYLLPWDQLAFWAITVGTSLAGYSPVLANETKFLLLGGYEVGQNALIRFYTLHVIGLPVIAILLMFIHFWRIRKDGGISRPM
jgi:quinol-cytochrome oxidoreductase complex cytochrome b subunit